MDEINKVFDILTERGQKPKLAKQDALLWPDSVDGCDGASVLALSPSDALIIDGHIQAGTMLAEARVSRARLVEPDRNARSVVLLVKSGGRNVLLGADLEHSANAERGWGAVLDSRLWSGRASLFKVPHHGSKTGQCDEVWSRLLIKDPLAILTPWKLGGRIVPSQQELHWLLTKTPNVYVSAIPQCVRRKRGPEVDRMIGTSSKHLSVELRIGGHIRARAPILDVQQEWSVDLFNGARLLQGRLWRAFPTG